MAQQPELFWKNPRLDNDSSSWPSIGCLCIGTGRFLRSVLVPLLEQHGDDANRPSSTILVQPRGRSFVDFMKTQAANAYPVDTILENGDTRTEWMDIAGAFSWGTAECRHAFQSHLPHFAAHLQILGVGVSEAGLASPHTTTMEHLFDLLRRLRPVLESQKLVILNTDNVPHNGQVIQSHMMALWKETQEQATTEELELLQDFLSNRVAFLDTMVDRIVSHRDGDPLVPRAEPTPTKAVVVLDPDGALPDWFARLRAKGLVIRRHAHQFQADLAWKLRIANATHTAVAHLMALSGFVSTTELAQTSVLMDYLDHLVHHQILPVCRGDPADNDEAPAVWTDWRQRLTHPTFGLSTFFITQNGAAKGGIRLGPTVWSLCCSNQGNNNNNNVPPPQASLAFAVAVLLRWLTPSRTIQRDENDTTNRNRMDVYRGDLVRVKEKEEDDTTVTYADGLRYNLAQGWYEFKCDCLLVKNEEMQEQQQLSKWLLELQLPTTPQPEAYEPVVDAYLKHTAAKNHQVPETPPWKSFVRAVATLYARLVAGEHPYTLLQEIVGQGSVFATRGCETPCTYLEDGLGDRGSVAVGAPLTYRPYSIPDHSALMEQRVSSWQMTSVLRSEVASVPVIDLHTHLLPPEHGPLCLWGIDELLTYHYLVAEYFMTAPATMTPQIFYDLPKADQADLIWKALFVDRSPVSEACRGVVTTLGVLGLETLVQERNLEGIREFYKSNFGGNDGAQRFSDLVFAKAGVQYNIMTNIPFDANEAQYWRGPNKVDNVSKHYRSAVRVDPLLTGDRAKIEFALKSAGYEVTLEGARQYLLDWCDTMKPEYVMASTPHDFVLPERGALALAQQGKKGSISVNSPLLQQPGAFAGVAKAQDGCDGTEDDVPSVIDENSDFLSEVLMKVCEERDLPLALKIGAHRAVNPQLKQAGDGVVAFADTGVLTRLCTRFPRVRFLATFLSRNNQHEACVLATKFRNLHIYGCWWFCNQPSLIQEITHMRVEMLGTAFTCQHSDARVLDQLLYKWSHTRAVIAKVLAAEYQKLALSGWQPTRLEIRRDVVRLFGGSYEEFMKKSLKNSQQ